MARTRDSAIYIITYRIQWKCPFNPGYHNQNARWKGDPLNTQDLNGWEISEFRMRLISFLVMVFGALLSQYLLQTWLVNSEEEKKESWER